MRPLGGIKLCLSLLVLLLLLLDSRYAICASGITWGYSLEELCTLPKVGLQNACPMTSVHVVGLPGGNDTGADPQVKIPIHHNHYG